MQPTRLTPREQRSILKVLTREEWAEESVAQVYWTAFDLGMLTMSLRTFYRYAADSGLVGDRRRRRQRRRSREKHGPIPVASRPGEVWSWDVTELRGPGNQRFRLYLVIDVYSRYPVAWRIEYREDRRLAVDMFATAFAQFGVPERIHSDNGGIMRSEVLIAALEAHEITRTYSRPRVSDDNPFSESLFRTVKYDLSCPEHFDSIQHAQEWTSEFLQHYATARRHSRMGWYTPHDLLHGTAIDVQAARQATLDRQYDANPGRFRNRPKAPTIPTLVGIKKTHTQPTTLSSHGFDGDRSVVL